jgi:formylglycine-generating enzyme required for sulfatase activity
MPPGWRCAEFCRRLSEMSAEKAAMRRYSLPTEAQWEYACRAGSPGRWCFSDRAGSTPRAVEENLMKEYGWLGEQSPYEVRRYRPNAFGLYDVHGNVWKWCADWYAADYYSQSPREDPTGPSSGSDRVLRGGSCEEEPAGARSAYRMNGKPDTENRFIGFRPARSL